MTGRVLVTGGAGFIGSHLVDALIAAGRHVTVLDDFSTGNRRNLDEAQRSGGLALVEGSILDADAVRRAFEHCTLAYHLAVQCVRRSLGNPRESHDVNATGTLTVLEEARRQGVKRFVYCSSSEVYGNSSVGLLDEETSPLRPTTVYGAAKLAGELYADAYRITYGLPTIIVRPFNAYGPRAHATGVRAEVLPRFVVRVLNGRAPVIFGDGSNGRDFTYVTEVARGLLLAGQTDGCVGKRINVAFGRMVTVADVAAAVIHACGRNDLGVFGIHARAKDLGVEYVDPRPGDVGLLHASTRRASEELGYRAKIGFAEGLALYLDWFRATCPDPETLLEEEVRNWTMPPSAAVAS